MIFLLKIERSNLQVEYIINNQKIKGNFIGIDKGGSKKSLLILNLNRYSKNMRMELKCDEK